MRDSLACDVTVRPADAWRVGVGVVALLSLACLTAWSASRPAGASPVAWLAAGMAAAAVVGSAASLWRAGSFRLGRHHGQWTLQPADSAPGPATAGSEPGELHVAIDLGSFMLLCFTSAAGTPRRQRRWLPVQQRDLPNDWHALRCAVFAPQHRAHPAPPATDPSSWR